MLLATLVYLTFQFLIFVCLHVLCKKLKLEGKTEIEREFHRAQHNNDFKDINRMNNFTENTVLFILKK